MLPPLHLRPPPAHSPAGSGHSTSIRFSHRGDLLASGRHDGIVVIFDIETNGVARKLRGHTRQVQSLSWSTNDRYLLTAGQDWKCVLWDLNDGSRVRTVRFEAAIFIAELHPKNHMLFVAALFEDQPVVVDVSSQIPVRYSIPSAPRRSQLERENATEKQAAQDAKQTTTMTLFTPSGEHIIAGTNKGWLNIIDTTTHEVKYSYRVTNNIIVYVRLTPSGRDIVVNASDRIVRTLHLPNFSDPKIDFDTLQLEVEHKFQDLVQRLSWNHVSFSPTGEYVTASTWMNHHIYVWERGQGSLVKILEGTKEELSVVEVRRSAHYTLHILIGCSGTPSGPSWQPSASIRAVCGYGRFCSPSAGRLSHPTLSKSRKTSSILSAKTSLTFSLSRNCTSDGSTKKTKKST